MFEQAVLTEHFQAILGQAAKAEKMYASLAETVTDPVLRAQVEQLERDKRRHVQLTQRLLEIVE